MDVDDQAVSVFRGAGQVGIHGGQFIAAQDVHIHHLDAPQNQPGPSRSRDREEVLSENDLYCEQLWSKRRGFPLYVPMLHRFLPPDCVRDGVSIGDVGMVGPDGLWDYFFNIFRDSEHPTNRGRVPDDFVPLHSYDDTDLQESDYATGSFVASPSADPEHNTFENFPGADYVFRCRSPKGAVLCLPFGSYLRKLSRGRDHVRDYAARNAKRWYEYFNGELGQGMPNGDLYVITGHEKALSGGIATFQNVSEHRRFDLIFRSLPNVAANGPRYRFNAGIPAQTKSFPSLSVPVERSNNTVFLHGFRVSLGLGIWNALFNTVSVQAIDEAPAPRTSSNRYIPFGSSRSKSILSSMLQTIGIGGGNGPREEVGPDERGITTDLLAPSPIQHPSRVIHKYILEKVPEAEVVITHDDDWQDLLEDSDHMEARDPRYLRRKLEQHRNICVEDSTAFLISTDDRMRLDNNAVDLPMPASAMEKLPLDRADAKAFTVSPRPSTVGHSISAGPPSPEPGPSDGAGDPKARAITPRSDGGCWTCRLRRKKCDETQGEDGSCQTCLRLTLECLGWGPKRPEWMKDKTAVERYKEHVKTQLTRAGLIRGQQRSAPLTPGLGMGPRRAYPPRPSGDTSMFSFTPAGDDIGGHHLSQFGSWRESSTFPRMPGTSDSAVYETPDMSFSPDFEADLMSTALDFEDGFDLDLGQFNDAFDVGAPYPDESAAAQFPDHQEHIDSLFRPAEDSEEEEVSASMSAFDFGYGRVVGGVDALQLQSDTNALSPADNISPLLAGHSSLQDNQNLYYFEHARKVHFVFGGNSISNVTYSMIDAQPRGAVSNAVCALGSLHDTHMRVSHGLKAPDSNPEHSTAKYFYDEAYSQLQKAKQDRGTYEESDALAALHLVWFSQLSGGMTDWESVLTVACDWLGQETDFLTSDNPKLALQRLSSSTQLIVKLTLWLDIVSSITLMRPPKYLSLCTRLFSDDANEQFQPEEIRMDSLSGWPEETLLAIAEVSALAHWKAEQASTGTLSNRDLIRRGEEIEQRLRRSVDWPRLRGDMLDKTPLHPTLVQRGSKNVDATPYPSTATREVVAKIFAETTLLYLHTVMSDSNPKINTSVSMIVQHLSQLPSSEVDRALVFPICLAGCMTDDAGQREFLKGRLLALDQSVGDLMRTRLLMEAVWQKRDVDGPKVDWREVMRDHGLNLLLA
ncbi:Zn(2)-C6 fungal-type domain-containing protein [Mycena kentingensis (nom. inval.)]|nr:Zn(2)-C6 fungal-type domain-containing protein [Mycena kentingensis (nom. inval.)]